MGGHGWAHAMLWVGVGGHRSLLMGMVWVWVQIKRKNVGLCHLSPESIWLVNKATSLSDTWPNKDLTPGIN